MIPPISRCFARTTLALLALGTVPAGAQTGGPSVTSLTLVNTLTGRPVAGYDPIPPAATLDLSRLPSRLNLRANVAGRIGSVRFGLDDKSNYKLENAAPYLLCGDAQPCPVGVFAPGAHRVSATPFTAAGGGGAAGTGILVNFTVVRGAAPAPQLTGLTLIDADTDRPVPGYDPIAAGARLRLSALPRHLNLRVNTAPGVGSVRFVWDGGAPRVENEAPFALCSDGRDRSGKKGDYFACGNTFTPGEHRLVATPFSKMFGGGVAGPALTWTVSVDR